VTVKPIEDVVPAARTIPVEKTAGRLQRAVLLSKVSATESAEMGSI